MLGDLDQHQPREQAGVRPGFSTINDIHVASQLHEKENEYKIPLCFVDYEKAFDSIEFTPLFKALETKTLIKLASLSYLICTMVPPRF